MKNNIVEILSILEWELKQGINPSISKNSDNTFNFYGNFRGTFGKIKVFKNGEVKYYLNNDKQLTTFNSKIYKLAEIFWASEESLIEKVKELKKNYSNRRINQALNKFG